MRRGRQEVRVGAYLALGCGLALLLHGCLAVPVGAGAARLVAAPNPSPDGSYTVYWTALPGASRYRLHENGVLDYEGAERVRAYADRAPGSYTYTLTYCVTALDVEACPLRPAAAPVTVRVTPP